jgi:hypothetical protein
MRLISTILNLQRFNEENESHPSDDDSTGKDVLLSSTAAPSPVNIQGYTQTVNFPFRL